MTFKHGVVGLSQILQYCFAFTKMQQSNLPALTYSVNEANSPQCFRIETK